MLSFRDVHASIAGAPVLRGVGFEVGAGRTAALVGRNGAGKTTTLRAAMGALPVRGAIRLDGGDLASVPPHRRAGLGVGYAPEDRRLFASLTVRDNVTLPCEVAGLARAETGRRLEEVLELVPEVEELLPRPAGEVSGGQGKMVALARALMIGTRVVLLDEPFQGLAPALAARYAGALRALRERPRPPAVLVTESNPALLRGLADTVLLIERGAVREGGAGDLASPPG